MALPLEKASELKQIIHNHLLKVGQTIIIPLCLSRLLSVLNCHGVRAAVCILDGRDQSVTLLLFICWFVCYDPPPP